MKGKKSTTTKLSVIFTETLKFDVKKCLDLT